MAVQTTSCQQPIEIREMSKDMKQYFDGLYSMLRNPDTLLRYLTIGYYYNKLPRYSMLDYLRSNLGSSWLKFATKIAQLVAEEKSLIVFDGPKDVYIPYSVLAQEILMILDIINAYEHKAGVTIDEVTTVNQFDSYYSDFTKFISQYTKQASSGLRTQKSADSTTVINRFIELGLIDDSYQKQKSPQKKEISIEEKEEISMEEEDISSSEESIEEPQTLDVNENGENEQKPLIEMLANDVKKVIKKAGKSSKHTRTTNKREKEREKDKKERSKEKRIEMKEKVKKEAGAGDYVFDRTKGFIHAVIEDMSKETEKQREIQRLIANAKQQLYTVFTTIIPTLQALAAKGFNVHIPTKEEFEGVGDRFVWLPVISDENFQILEGTKYKYTVNTMATPKECWLDTEIIGANDSKGKKLYYKFAEL